MTDLTRSCLINCTLIPSWKLNDIRSAIAPFDMSGLGSEIADLAVGSDFVSGDPTTETYIGESAYFLISFVNQSADTLVDVQLDVFTSTSRNRLRVVNETVDELITGQRIERVVRHEVRELGPHSLSVTILFRGTDNITQMLQQSVRFTSAIPVDVKPKSVISNGHLFLEVQVDTKMSTPVFLGQPTLDLKESYRLVKIHGEEETEVIDVGRIVKPGDKTRFLFELAPVDPEVFATSVGKVKLSWTHAMGVRGRLQTDCIDIKKN